MIQNSFTITGLTSGSFSVFPNNGPYIYTSASSGSNGLYIPLQHEKLNIGNAIAMGCVTEGDRYARRVDTANQPTPNPGATGERSLRSCFDGRYIYMVYYYVSTNYELRFARFDCETATWVAKDIIIVSQSNDFPRRVPGVYGSIDVDSNGKLYVNYPLYSSKGYHRLNWAYSTNSGSTWTNAQTMPSSPGSMDSEVPYNIFCVGTNVYHFYTWGTLPYYQKCMCYNGSSWSSEDTFQASISAAYHFTGRPAIWTDNSGSPRMTIVCTARDNHTAYSFDSSTGSNPAWINQIMASNGTYYDSTWYYTNTVTMYNGYPYFVWWHYWNYNVQQFFHGGSLYFLGKHRETYSSWDSGSGFQINKYGFYPSDVYWYNSDDLRVMASSVSPDRAVYVYTGNSGSGSYVITDSLIRYQISAGEVNIW